MNDYDASVLPPGTRIDQYVIRGVLGRGGFGITYLIRDEALQKDFALKEFFPEGLVRREGTSIRFSASPNSESDYRWGLRKFYDEARLLAQFNHANIVNVRRVFEANNSAYMLLDFIKGSSLEKWLQGLDSPATQEELDLIAAPLLSALELVHENRTWHLDISPENVMIRAFDGAPILLDFGASRFEIKQHSQLVSALVFKSGYSAPEQYTSNADRYGPWTDIYAFGATLYRAISGSRPIEATERQLHDEQLSAAQIGKGRYRVKFLKAIDTAMKLPPRERPQSVAEWRKDLLEGGSRMVAPAMTRILTGRTKVPASPTSDMQIPLNRRIAVAPVLVLKSLGDRRTMLLLLAGAILVASLITGVITLLVPSWTRSTSVPMQEDLRMRIEPKQNRLSEAAEAWDAIKDTTNVAVLEAFMTRYKDSFYADLARVRTDELKQKQAIIATPPPPPKPERCDGAQVPVGASERRCIKPGSGKTTWFRDCADCPLMVVVPAGSFTMGSPADEPERSGGEDQRAVALAKPFAVGALAATRGEFAAFVKATAHKMDGGCFTRIGAVWIEQLGRSWQSPGFEQDDRHPVTCVNWHDANAYAAWLSKETGKRYRLLSETEREYVTRAGSTTPFWWGATVSTAQANYNGHYPYAGGSRGYFREKTISADSSVSNAWGLYNVHGNVWDWTEDCWNVSNAGNPGDGSARASGNCASRVLRGGSWLNGPNSLRSAARLGAKPDLRHNDIGFRVARTID